MKKLLLSTFAICLTSLVVIGQTYFSEDFEAGFPADWSMDGGWVYSDAADFGSAYFAPDEHTQFIGVNDDALGNGVVSDGRVVTSDIDLTEATGTILLEMESYFGNGDYQGLDERATVYASTDGGMNWELVGDLEDQAGFEWRKVTVFLDNYAGQVIQLAFDYTDGDQWNYGWAIDDITIGAPTIVRDASIALGAGSFINGGLIGVDAEVAGVIANAAIEEITSIDVNWSDGTNTYTQSMTDISIPFNSSMPFTHPDVFTIVDGESEIDVWVSNVNGMGDDDDTTNDASSLSISGVTPNPNKAVVVEEATGTWCPWCPRGEVFLQGMSDRYGKHFIGIAVHNQDPMVNADYDGALTSFPGFTGFPSVIHQRTEVLDPSEIEMPSVEDMLDNPPAILTVGVAYDESTRDLDVSVDINFMMDVSGEHRLAVILTEDGVTGTGAEWGQANNYSGGGFGPMGGYENLPSTVPAEDMVYNHVGRELIGGYDGVMGSVPETAVAGDRHPYFFETVTVDAGYNTNNMHVIALLLDDDGEVVNAVSSTMEEAIAQGLAFPVSAEDVYRNDLADVFPNPASEKVNIELALATSSDVYVEVYNAVGQRVAANDYGKMSGNNIIPFDVANFASGMYTIHIKLDESLITKKISVQR